MNGHTGMWSNRRSAESSEQWQRLLDHLDAAVLIIDVDDRLLYSNPGWALFCADKDRATGTLFRDCLHPADLPLWRRFRRYLDAGESTAPLTLRLLGQGAELCWCELRARPLRDDAPWPVSLILRDITDQVRRQRLRDAGYRSLEQLVNGLPAMLYRARNDRDWSMEYVSAGCLELTGYAAEALLNQAGPRFGNLIDTADADRVWQEVQGALEQRTGFELRYRLVHADGRSRHVSEKGRGLYATNGAILGVEGLILALEQR